MKIQRRYFDQTEWEVIDEKTARDSLGRYFVNVDLAITEILDGHTIRTSYAQYRLAKE